MNVLRDSRRKSTEHCRSVYEVSVFFSASEGLFLGGGVLFVIISPTKVEAVDMQITSAISHSFRVRKIAGIIPKIIRIIKYPIAVLFSFFIVQIYK